MAYASDKQFRPRLLGVEASLHHATINMIGETNPSLVDGASTLSYKPLFLLSWGMRSDRLEWHILKFFCLNLLFLLFASALVAAELEGDARVLDGSHLELDGKPIRLYGIAAPHLKQACEWPNKTVACG